MALICCTVGDVEPIAVELIDELVKGEIQGDDEITQFAVVLRFVGKGADVGGLSETVLRGFGTADYLVHRVAPIARGDNNGGTPCLTQRVEDVVDEGDKILSLEFSRGIVDAQAACGGRCGEFLHCEVFH